jgi:hypothetical protein
VLLHQLSNQEWTRVNMKICVILLGSLQQWLQTSKSYIKTRISVPIAVVPCTVEEKDCNHHGILEELDVLAQAIIEEDST